MVGYKQTDVGLIPNDWEFASIGKLAHIETGTTPPTIDRSNYGNDFLFVSPADLGENKWIEKAEKKLSKKGFSISRNSQRGICFHTSPIFPKCWYGIIVLFLLARIAVELPVAQQTPRRSQRAVLSHWAPHKHSLPYQ